MQKSMQVKSANGCPIITGERVTARIMGAICRGTVQAFRPADLPADMVMVKWDSLLGWPKGLTVRELIGELSAVYCHCEPELAPNRELVTAGLLAA